MALSPLRELCERTGCAVLVIAHVVKQFNKYAPLSAVGGSGGGLAGACRAIYAVGMNPDDRDERIMAQLKCNIAEPRASVAYELDVREFDDGVTAPILVPRGESDVTAGAVLAGGGRERATKRDAAAEWLKNYRYAAGQPIPARQIREDGERQASPG
jgi:hypothetical protein